VLSSFARFLVRRVPPRFIDLIVRIFDADRLISMQRSEIAFLQSQVADAQNLCGDKCVELDEAEQLIVTMTGELELLRSIVDNEAPGLSERIAGAIHTLHSIHDEASHEHDHR
jgi:hypothetical protein